MLSSRLHRRLVALVASAPLFAIAGPIVPASATPDPVAQANMTPSLVGGLRIGPRAGFRGDVAHGINGTTALFSVHVDSGTTLNTITVNVAETTGSFPFYRDFNNTDGFAVYNDANDNGVLDPAEYAAGPVTQPGYGVTGNGTAAVVTLTGDPAKATGHTAYVITAHPADGTYTDRTAAFTVPIGGVVTSAGNIPLAAVKVDPVVIDSMPPSLIPTANFTVRSRIPTVNCKQGSPAGACGDDGYQVYLGGTPIEDGEKIAFFNAASDFSDGALLVQSNNAPALYDVNGISDASPGIELSIGNGTGRNAAVNGSRALNNQLTDDVYPALWDDMGNIGSLGKFTNDQPCHLGDAGCTAAQQIVPHGNDVTGPKLTTSYTASMSDITATSNQTAVPVTGTLTGLDSARPVNTDQAPVTQKATLRHVNPDGTVIYAAPPTYSAGSATPTAASPFPTIQTLVDSHDDTKFPEDQNVQSFGELLDVAGNATGVLTAIKTKDTTAPKFVTFSLIDTNNNSKPDAGEKYRVVFDDPMNSTRITSTNVNTQLTVATGATCDAQDPDKCAYFGDSPTVSWTDPQSLNITLGTPQCDDPSMPLDPIHCPVNSKRLAVAGDVVTAVNSGGTPVADPVGNVVTPNTVTIGQPFVVAYQAGTIDTSDPTGNNIYATGRDGIVDQVQIDFSGPLNPTTVNATTASKFKVSVPGDSVTPAIALTNSNKSLILSFAPTDTSKYALWGTNAKPTVQLTDGTVLKAANNQAIGAFPIVADDKVAPIPVSIVTADTNADGKLDAVKITYSESIQAGHENQCGYTVSGYSDPAYSPTGASQTPSPATCPSGTPATGRNKPTTSGNVVTLTLKQPGSFDTGNTPLVSFNGANDLPAFAPNTTGSGGPTAGPTWCASNASLTTSVTPVPPCPVVDTAGNGLNTFSGFAADQAGPAIVGRATADRDADGHIDELDVTLSEEVDVTRVGLAQFEIAAPVYTILGVSVAPGNDKEVRIRLAQSTGAGDTAEKPTLKYTGGGLFDNSDPSIATPVDAAAVQVTDKAGPAIMSACTSMTFPAGTDAAEKTAELGSCPEGAGNKMLVLFSEALDTTAGTLVAADFAVQQPAGTAKTITNSGNITPTNATDGKSATVTLTFADNTLDMTQPAYVKFSGPGVIGDNSAGKTPNTQTTLITSAGSPTVTLHLTCPVTSSAGYCSATYVNTGAAGTNGIVGWRLVEANSAPPIPAATDFSSTQPTVYPSDNSVLPEGLHTLWLRGKDGFGRMTPQVSDAITVLKSPKINNVQLADSRIAKPNTWPTGQTVLDGDKVQVGADGQGSDSLHWAAGDAETGGGCLAVYMSIDLRALSGRSNQSSLGPTSCDYKTNTAPPSRAMQFPQVIVTKTTHYPVGTVLRPAGTADQGYLVTDGPNGTQLRRHFISPNARRSWQITDAQVINVPTAVITGIPLGSPIGYRDGAIVKAPGNPYYYVIDSHKKAVSTATLSYWHVPTTTAYAVTVGELNAMPKLPGVGPGMHLPGMFIKFSNGTIQEIAKNSTGATVRRYVTSAGLTTRVPASHVFPANTQDASLPVDTWVLGYRDGTLLKVTATQYAVVARSSLRTFANAFTFNTLGYATSNARAFSSAGMGHVLAQAYRNGTAIDRYTITGVVITVTNQAGASTQATVLPSVPGIYGVGTYDLAPNGWDFTHN